MIESVRTYGLIGGSFLFALAVLAGFWLMKTGKPYRSGIFNIHKLIALAASVLIILALYWNRISEASDSYSATELFSIGGFLTVILFGTGAMLSIGKPDHKVVLYGHRIGAGLAVLAVLLIVYLKMTGRF
jgi:hypothetical protein